MSAQHADGNLQDSMPFADSANCLLGSNVHSKGSTTPNTSKFHSGAGASTAGVATSVSYKDAPGLLQKLDQQERQVQEVLQQLGCDAATYQQLYSTQLLRRAVSEPVRVAGLLAMTTAERLDFLAEVRAPTSTEIMGCSAVAEPQQQPTPAAAVLFVLRPRQRQRRVACGGAWGWPMHRHACPKVRFPDHSIGRQLKGLRMHLLWHAVACCACLERLPAFCTPSWCF